VSRAKHLVLAERIAHERELREAEKVAFDHERELRSVFDQHERELRTQEESAVEKARDIQFNEYERRLSDLNHAHELERQRNAESVSRNEYDIFVKEARIREDSLNKALTDKFQASHNTLSDRLDRELKDINVSGTEGFRETDAERKGHESATEKLTTAANIASENSRASRRWIIGLAVGMVFSIIASVLGLITLIIHLSEPVARAVGS
jgi:hypothetical protein